MEVSKRTAGVQAPPIASVMARVAAMRDAGRAVWSMAQASPWYGPPEEASADLSAALRSGRANGYSPDEGFLSTRRAVARDFASRRGIELDPEAGLHLTVGASQAFLSALLSVTDPGDRVLLLEPWYFDHEFALRFCSLETVSTAMSTGGGRWSIPLEEVAGAARTCRAVVVVSPGNPTGSVMPGDDLERLVLACADSGTFVLLDETYERFDFSGRSRHPWQAGRPRNLLSFGSFSKSHGIPGWRLGYLFGDEDILAQALKVQDSAVICPPSPAQILLESALAVEGWVEARAAGIRTRLEACRGALYGPGRLEWIEPDGGFFTLARVGGGADEAAACESLLEEAGIAVVPGSAFGPAGRGHVRISFGCLGEGEVEPAMEALRRWNTAG